MASLIETIRNHPTIKALGVDQATVTGLTEDAVGALYGFHRWPYLKQVNRTLTWTAGSPTKTFADVVRIISIRYPETSTKHRPMEFMDDNKFNQFKYTNDQETVPYAWRDAGFNGKDATVEIWKYPSSAVVFLADYYAYPNATDFDLLPARFNRLVRQLVLAEIPNSGVTPINVEYMIRDAIARDEIMTGEVDYVGMDSYQDATMRSINDPQ